MPTPTNCPCGSDLAYAECCQPFHDRREKAPTAQALMRSRYTAYVLGLVDYLVETTHPFARARDLATAYQQTFETIQWIDLKICSTFQGGPADKTGKVEFKASYLQGSRHSVHHEHSRFKRYKGDWHYFDGVVSDQK